MRNLLLALAIASTSLPAAAQTAKSGIEVWQKGDPAGAVAIWRPLAEKGDPDSAYNLGQAYRLGKGVPLDLTQALTWFERAARKGHIDASADLGLLLFQNGNRVAGMRWLKVAADAGEPRSLLIVGTALYNGDDVTPDPVKAYAYISRAAAQGLAPAQATLADMDAAMPIEQRQKGIAMAQAMIAKKPATTTPSVKVATAKPPAVKQTPAKQPAAKSAPVIAKPVVAASGKWRIQLGAFGQRKSAEALFGKVSGKLSGRQAYYVPAGAVVRLQVGPFESRGAASAACASLAPQPCFAVAGP